MTPHLTDNADTSPKQGAAVTRSEGGHEVVDIGDMGTRVPLEDLQTPLLKGSEDAFRWRVPTWWPSWAGIDDSHVSKVWVAIFVAIASSLVSCFFNVFLETCLSLVWETIPEAIIGPLSGSLLWPKYTYMVVACTAMGLLVGLSLTLIGFPGDLPFIVYCLHYRNFVPIKYFLPMLLCSAASITGGGSLGPEAAIVLLCASVAGVIGHALGHHGKKLRGTTLCGMAGGFAAFFGVPFGGPLFALEVAHRMGLEYFESASYAVLSGLICCVLYHILSVKPLGAIWTFAEDLEQPTSGLVIQGAAMGVLGAFCAFLFLKIHKSIGFCLDAIKFKKYPLLASSLAGSSLAILALFVPHTLFWGEFEMQTIIDRGASKLPHIWPSSQIYKYSLADPLANAMVSIAKMLAISITIHGGFRGGFIFPLFLAGSAMGSAIQLWVPSLNLSVATMAMAASLDVAITRTPFGSALILASLSGQPNILQPVVASSLVSLMLTNFDRFQLIKPQRARAWVDIDLDDEGYDHTAGE